jgi:hypothetical protein
MYYLVYFEMEKKYSIVEETSIVSIEDDSIQVVWEGDERTDVIEGVLKDKCK